MTEHKAETDVIGQCLVCGEKFYDETAYRQYVTGERHEHLPAPMKLTATSLDRLLDMFSVAVVASGRPQVLIARDAGLSTKHLSQMMTGRVTGSLDAWQRVVDSAGVTFTAQVLVNRPGSEKGSDHA